ncbi:MAG: AtpZ/AtpI family protein [Elusimicrobiales bacterium]|nr:AtpZ/AtpI family protein [Elusimicrobiales bacterium]
MIDKKNNAFKYTQIGLELAGAVLLGFYGGYKLDGFLDSLPWCTVLGSFAGMAAGFYLLYRAVKKDDEDA